MKDKINKIVTSKKVLVCTTALTVALPNIAHASGEVSGGTSLLDANTTGIIAKFAADIVPTVTTLLGIIVPVGLSLWAIGFGVKKGLAFLQKKAKSAL